MRRGKDASLKALISAMAEAESKSYYEEQENALNDLSGLLKTFFPIRLNDFHVFYHNQMLYLHNLYMRHYKFFVYYLLLFLVFVNIY